VNKSRPEYPPKECEFDITENGRNRTFFAPYALPSVSPAVSLFLTAGDAEDVTEDADNQSNLISNSLLLVDLSLWRAPEFLDTAEQFPRGGRFRIGGNQSFELPFGILEQTGFGIENTERQMRFCIFFFRPL
jgi:hypothetical protein